ncbi:MAG: hypothetical protein NW241_07420 [Bacteroidia bacterium]|nr:hypothetical protein [Bacteroidia bacterium]
MRHLKLHLATIISTSIHSRDTLALVLSRITPQTRSVTFDFQGVSFISRSFAHQYLHDIERLRQQGMQVSAEHAGEMVQFMLNRVAESMKSARPQQMPELDTYTVHKLSSLDELEALLAS